MTLNGLYQLNVKDDKFIFFKQNFSSIIAVCVVFLILAIVVIVWRLIRKLSAQNAVHHNDDGMSIQEILNQSAPIGAI